MILVTGGTGLVGAHLLLHLLQLGKEVKATYRTTSNLKEVEKVFSYYSEASNSLFKKINWVEADLNDIPALEIAFQNVTQVYHCAALISFNPSDYELLRTVNVEGTKNIVNLCIAHQIKKLCYVSSIAAIGRTLDEQAATEETDWTTHHANVYALSKMDAELEVWRGSQENLPVVIVNPGVIIGPGFWDTGTGLLFQNAYKARKFYPPGGTAFVAVQDVVSLMTQLMDAAVKNEKFIAVAENLSYKEILDRLTKAFNRSGPKIQLKFWQLELFWRLDWLAVLLTNRDRRLTKNSVRSLRKTQRFNNSKSKEFLGRSYESLENIITLSCAKFIEENP
ncbi:ADP-L-glycero-D-manno-heptose-6-epimerase [Arenibacter antarcticus]|uniref:NAD-dependent epimerase/dehydratase family protein n=1 Tax=Arenibacter antarcticus TaxID=2040469 RepID=A0ABW5VM37_9FLAO|nr:NAD-dependent epimerase/dehydratase family protein [Arenibacter sp. H213]MCM4166839.1 NAD-dependent epimerase [Arenibacter sp. H213]